MRKQGRWNETSSGGTRGDSSGSSGEEEETR
mgnify:CR=1 FL=1